MQVAPRLAAAVLNVKEGGDLRRPTRLLFEAGNTVVLISTFSLNFEPFSLFLLL